MTATWTSPKTWAYEETLESSEFNTYIRDNQEYLKTQTDIISTDITIVLTVTKDSVSLETGDGQLYWTVPEALDGYVISSIHCGVHTVSSSGTPTFQVHNDTDSVDILSTEVTIDANEKTSYTAATPPVVNTSNDDLATGDQLRFDCDVKGTGTKGWDCIIKATEA